MIKLAQPRFDSVVLPLFSVVVVLLAVSPVDDAPILLAVRNRGKIGDDRNIFRMTPWCAHRAFEARITCSGIELVHTWQVVAQACVGSG